MFPSGRRLTLLLIFCAQFNLSMGENAAEAAGSDSLALSRLFAEEHVEDIALDLRRTGLRLSPEERYEFLRKWLLPSETHDTWRLPYAFTPTDPSPPVRTALGIKSAGGELISPVFDLIEVAHVLGRLDQLEADIRRRETGGDPHAHKAKLAYLTLIAIEEQAAASIDERLWQFLQLALADADTEVSPPPAEWLVFTKCADVERLRSQTAECIFKYLDWPQEGGRTVAQRHWTRLDALSRPIITENQHRPGEQQWHLVRNSTASTNGQGCPNSIWNLQPGIAENIVSHHEDYLYFAVPLRGEYAVEGDMTGDGWLDAQVSVAGRWIAPTYTRDELLVGSFRQKFPPRKLPLKLTAWKGWSHYRAVVASDAARHYINGRLVHEELLSADSNPWVAIRSSFWRTGAVRNLTITGNPSIPSEIDMLADPGLNDWTGYFGESVGISDSDWTLDGNELQALKNPSQHAAGTFTESILRYHRPLLEDGSVEYEFFYDPTSHEVHPAVGRMVLLLDPASVKLHWLTDGREDRTGLAPDNTVDSSEDRLTEGPLPLRTGDWNHLALRLKDDLITVVLNETPIFARRLDRENPRTFGLFHYADQSAVRVRKLIHRGNWPRQLPGISDQRLASDETRRLDRNVEHMPATFVHSFGINDEWDAKFTLAPGTLPQHLTPTESGLRTSRKASAAFQDVTLVADLKVQGDFDIIAEYTAFSATPIPGGHAAANLLIRLENESSDTFYIMRKHVVTDSGTHSELGSCAVVRQLQPRKEYKIFGSSPMEETAGKLRLSRRGNQLYYLTAENDSDNYQLRGEREITRDEIRADGLRLWNQAAGSGTVSSVTWKSLTVKAERLSGGAVE